MALRASDRLGVYEIGSLLGAGGMGEVYRARDTTLGRDVALKILPASFTNDPERVARFRREAQVLASLNHPHVAQIHGLEEANSTQFADHYDARDDDWCRSDSRDGRLHVTGTSEGAPR